jgi:hypothetical protein
MSFRTSLPRRLGLPRVASKHCSGLALVQYPRLAHKRSRCSQSVQCLTPNLLPYLLENILERDIV